MKTLALVLAAAATLFAQAPAAPKSVLGTVSAMRPESAELEIKPESGAPVLVKVSGATITKKVAPGQTDLSKAEPINVTDVAMGDRVLVTLSADSNDARRIIVIAATDLTKRESSDKLDWQRRGVAGVVSAISGNDVTVEVRSMGGATKYTVTAGPKTTFMKYAPDSVKYADAKTSSLAEVAVGDQLRARGQKSADGMKVDAEQVVFGTFLSKAGTITAVNAASNEITIKDLGNNKPVTVKFTSESQLKRMPPMAQMQTMMMGIAAGGRGAPPATGAAPAAPAAPATPPAPPAGRGPGPAGAGGGRGPGAGGPRGPDLAQILERMPAVKIDELKNGDIVVLSALRGAAPNQITAVTFVSNAEELVKLTASPTGPAPSLQGLASSIGNSGP